MINVIYKIRNRSGLFSHGIVKKSWYKDEYSITWSSKGKMWVTEKGVKDHLLKCALKRVPFESWEVVKVVIEPTKPIEEWIDQAMLMKVLAKLE